MAEAWLTERDQRRVDRLMRAAFGAERGPAWSCHEQEACILVAGVVETIEAAGDERIVERSDREQTSAEQVARKPSRRQHQEQIGFGNTELNMLALIATAPLLR